MAEAMARVAHIWLLASDLFERAHYLAVEHLFGDQNAVARSRPRS
jgi:uncharacterized protein (DUF2384 family)